MKYVSKSVEDTKSFAKTFVESLSQEEDAIVVALEGDLGSGKTTFSQLVGEALGVREGIQSPTFLIEKIYELYDKPWKHLVHIDAYRLDKPEELLHLGWNEIISRPDNLILVEWADKVRDIMPDDALRISFTFIDETTREIDIHES
ncbi:MAG: tRNA (adenosine(37)-N6)-threonylcarbamoyltransferase complex ATPase subunit type 1 TsaE [Patescibacteria group bacterium]